MIDSLLLFCECSLVEFVGGEGKESQQSQSSLHIVNEVDVVVHLAFQDGLFRMDTFDSQTEHGVCGLSFSNVAVELGITVLGADVTDFIVPPHDRSPVGFVIFKENSVIVRVFPQSAKDVLGAGLLVPFDTLEGECLEGLGNVENSSFLSSLVLQVDATSGSI